jgi:hypothetical protein
MIDYGAPVPRSLPKYEHLRMSPAALFEVSEPWTPAPFLLRKTLHCLGGVHRLAAPREISCHTLALQINVVKGHGSLAGKFRL